MDDGSPDRKRSTLVAATMPLLLLLVLSFMCRVPAEPSCPVRIDDQTLPPAALTTLTGAATAAAAAAEASVNGGYVASLVYNGQTLLSRGYGYAQDPGGAAPDVKESLFRVGSVTKVFTALLTLVARDQGRLALDDTLAQHLPKLVGSALGSVPLRALLSHVGGVPREAPCPENDCNLTTAQLLPALRDMTLLGPPYVRPAYSNLGFALLGHVASAALDAGPDGVAAALAQHVFAPLGMSSSGFDYTDDAVLSRLANGTANRGPLDHLGWGNPCGGMYASGADMARLLQWLTSNNDNGNAATKKDGQPLGLRNTTRAEWLYQSAFVFGSGAGGYGLAWELAPPTAAQQLWIRGKSGDISSWSSQMIVVPETRLAVAVLASDADMSASTIAQAMLDAVLPNATALLRAQATAALASRAVPPNPERFVGTYKVQSLAAGGVVTIKVSLDGRDQRLAAVGGFGNNQFPVLLTYADAYNATASQFTLHMPPTLPVDCLLLSELSWDGEPVVIDTAEGTLWFPHMLVGDVLRKQKTQPEQGGD